MSSAESLEKSHQKAQRLLAKYDDLKLEHAALNKQVERVSMTLALKPEIDQFMESLQTAIHQKTVGKFERLLSSILNDVFPGIGNVKIDIETKRQAASLSISIENNGFPEDAFAAQGGSIANVLSLGLRFIALTRGGFRKFIVLDEPDCWLKIDRVPAFVNVIGALSREMGIQVLMISHRDTAYFEKQATLVEIKVDKTEMLAGNKVKSLTIGNIQGHPIEWTSEQTGIRSIRLKNFMSYSDVSIPLSPGFTVLIGDNNIGKSGGIMGLRSLIRDEWKDIFIRHNEDSALVALDLGPEGTVLSARSKTGAKKNFQAHLNGPHTETIGAKPPKWLLELGFDSEAHGIRKDDAGTPAWINELGFDDQPMDIQIGLQKQPVFLLDKSGTQQASVLAMGLEAQFFQKIQSLYKADHKQHADLLKNGKKRLAEIEKQIDILRPIERINRDAENAKQQFNEIAKQQTELKTKQTLIDQLIKLAPLSLVNPVTIEPKYTHQYASTERIETTVNRLNELQPFTALKPIVMSNAAPMKDLRDLTNMLNALQINPSILQAKPISMNAVVPDYKSPDALRAVGNPLHRYRLIKDIKPIVINPDYTPINHDTVEPTLTTLTTIHEKIKLGQSELKSVEMEGQSIDESLKSIQEEMGDACPACGQSIDCSNDHSHHQGM